VLCYREARYDEAARHFAQVLVLYQADGAKGDEDEDGGPVECQMAYLCDARNDLSGTNLGVMLHHVRERAKRAAVLNALYCSLSSDFDWDNTPSCGILF